MSNDKNELLEWYLASLRKNAQSKAAAAHFTPMGLIEADKELLKSLIEKDSSTEQTTNSSSKAGLARSPRQVDGALADPKVKLTHRSGVISICFILCAISIYVCTIASWQTAALTATVLAVPASLLIIYFAHRDNIKASTSEGNTLTKMSTELELMQQKELLIFDYCPFMLCKLNGSGYIIALNEASTNITEYNKEELTGVQFETFLPAESKAIFLESLQRCREKQEPEQIEIRIRSKTGELKDILWKIEWSQSSGAYFCMAEDISMRKNNERMKAEITAMINHDLRAPISALAFWIDNMLLGTYGDVTQNMEDTLKRTAKNTQTILSLLDNLLDAEKLDSGTMKTHRNAVKVQDLFEETAKLYEDWFKEEKIQLHIETSDLVASADIDQTCRILSNFCSNAIKWSPAESTVKMRAAQEGDFVVIEVEDSGPGIPLDRQEDLFQRWGMLDSGQQRKTAGSGLGLYIAKKFAILQGGAVGFRKADNGGTIFWVSLHRHSQP